MAKKMDLTPSPINAADVYTSMESARQPFLDRARECAELVAPELIPPEGADDHTSFARLHDGTGAQGLQSLVSKTLQVLFPTDRSFIRLEASDERRAELIKEVQNVKEAEGMLAELGSTLQFSERALLRRYVSSGLDAHMPNVFRHAYTAGNVLLHVTKSGKPKVFGMDRYVLRRDYLGEVSLGIIRESINPEALKGRVPAEAIEREKQDRGLQPDDRIDSVPLYTVIERRIEGSDDRVIVHQQALGHVVEDSQGNFDTKKSPFIWVWTQPVSGSSYSYSYVHTNYDDLMTLEELSKDLTEISAAAAVLRWIVKRGGLGALSLRKLHKMKNGAYMYGDPDAITPISLAGKIQDMVIVKEQIAEIRSRLREAFLMFGAARRDAERVTAFENAQVLNELKSNLSSFFGPLAPNLQERLANVMVDQMREIGIMPKYKDGYIDFVIVTGAAALARETSTQSLLNALQVISSTWNDTLERYANFPAFVDAVMEGLGALNPKGLWKTTEEIQEADKARQIESLAPEVLKGAPAPQ